jgi:hypothetical protein
MKTYSGRRFDAKHRGLIAEVKVIDGNVVGKLSLRLDLACHSPSGFEWGYAGSGPAQLALALLADALGSDQTALRLHQPFKFKTIARLDRDVPWRMTEGDVLRYAAAISELPLVRRPDGEIRRSCLDCVGYLRDRGLLAADQFGIFELAPGVTSAVAREIVAQRLGGKDCHIL